MSRKLIFGVIGGAAVIIASALAFRLATGECPLGCFMKYVHSEAPAAES